MRDEVLKQQVNRTGADRSKVARLGEEEQLIFTEGRAVAQELVSWPRDIPRKLPRGVR